MQDPRQREFLKSLEGELSNILSYWQKHTFDLEHGGFVGRIDHRNAVDPKHPKGIILNTRILWSFSRANNFYKDQRFDLECRRAYQYLREHFSDPKYGGVFWEVNFRGRPTNKRKQIYAQAFCIYALSEFFAYSGEQEALDWALQLFRRIEDIAYDPIEGGYFEAFGEDWQPIEDVRLSEKDLNSPKSTNTQLHILEAYTTLFAVSGEAAVKRSLLRLLKLFPEKMLGEDHHLKLFFSQEWNCESSEISYGHDIESAWLLIHAARTCGEKEIVKLFEALGVEIADIFLENALDDEFGVLNARDRDTGHVDTDRHWWPQIEAMVGLVYAWDITKDRAYLDASTQIWDFTKACIIDHQRGEWYFRVDAAGDPYTEENKVGPWKCPYHNSRGLMEILEHLS